tara:strand:+ start:349 stop:594 length:246 start_codon:yes stop_codon:yes gene_type:complete
VLPAASSDDDLVAALQALRDQVAEGKTAPQRPPSVLVLFRDQFGTALGDIFSGIVSRTVEIEQAEQEQAEQKQAEQEQLGA